MKRNYLDLFLAISLLVIATLSSFAQRSNGLIVEGTVTVQEGTADGAVIQMFRDGQRLDNYGIGTDGKYKTELNYNHEFTLIFSCPGNFPQKIVVNTRVPQSVLQRNPLFPPFTVNINLFTEIQGIDRTFSENTVLKIYYSESVDNFISDLYYNDAQIKHLIDQAILQSKMIDKEADYLATLTKAELAELRKEYDQLIKEAETEYRNEQFLNALDGYQAASQIFPKEQYPRDRIAEINDLLGMLMVANEREKALIERFETLIKQGDMHFDQKEYEEARNSYQRALSVRPGHSHASQRLDEINNILRQLIIDREYNNLIASADNAFREVLYSEAQQIYRQALQLKPGESWPKQRIEEIQKIMQQQVADAEKQKNYDESVFQAELMYQKQFYDRAISFYENALTYKEGDSLATARIAEIKELMAELANRTMYDKLIAAADRAYNRKRYEEALDPYRQAADILPEEEWPGIQIENINNILNAEKNFKDLTGRADIAFTEQRYPESKVLYEQALEIRSDDKYVQGRIAEINGILGKIAQLEQQYKNLVDRADRLFGEEKYDESKTVFTEAGKLKPSETYPPEMISRIDSIAEEQTRLLAEQKAAEEAARIAAEQARLAALQAEKDSQYNTAIGRGDSLFTAAVYEQSKSEYQSALKIKSDESYPKEKIAEIDNLMVQLAAAQRSYDQAIAAGDLEFRREAFAEAKSYYMAATEAKPEESYPAEMITRIDSITTERARLAAEAEAAEQARLAALQAEKDSQYNRAVGRGDSLFTAAVYEQSKSEYQSALKIKSDESYPKEKIAEIDNLMVQLAAAQRSYDQAIAAGDLEFRREAFAEAKSYYMAATEAKPEESYPAEMITRIDSITTERARLAAEAEAAEQARLAALQAEKDSQYNRAVGRGDSLFTAAVYEQSKSEYQSALKIKSDESYPKEKIAEIDNLMVQLAAAQRSYDQAIAAGDLEFRREAFAEAKSYYMAATEAKPEESYPAEMITRIDSITTERARLAAEAEAAEQARLAALQAEKDSQYNRAVGRGDSLFTAAVYEQSKSEYQSALKIKSDESYPKEKIAEIDRIVREQMVARLEQERIDKSYQDAIFFADQQFNIRNYNQAKQSYEKALTIKPEEVYPGERVEAIDKILEQQETDEAYRTVILAADGLFRSRTYNEAKEEYNKALTLKPGESYPANQIKKIDDIFRQEEERILAEQKAAADLEERKRVLEQQKQEMLEVEIMSDAGLNQLYDQYIAQADESFDNKQYNISRAWYYRAWDIKPKETYPPARISEINKLVNGLLLNQRDRDYQGFIDLADSTFRENQLAVARGWYNRALSVKSEESYPKEQLQAISKLIEERMASRSGEKFEEYSETAKEAFENNNYNVARFWYRKALELRPDDENVKHQLEEIRKAVN